MEYLVISDTILNRLIDSINRLLSEGWKCQGGICAYENNNFDDYFYQAMIKVKVDKPV